MVKVYTKPSRVQCNATYKALNERGIPFEKIDISQGLEALQFFQGLGHLQTPVVVTDDDHWSGFRPDKIEGMAA
ncbi:glutaredoxin-like protein NrdH [Glutamicibacter nicotianae]|uniref:glutaredoxin-like protein NrdH n=1 Tax=Glutamicibacter nicotianae TaxID=37929 RepID=UPI000EF8E5D7|nr:glutaredoxin-like protein NrdH [Glutamicibacter nicotianae]